MSDSPTIIYTKTDEAPALATYSFLPIIQAFTRSSGIDVDIRDISLSGRILANFSDHLDDDQRISDLLKKLSEFSLHSIEQPIKTRQWENMSFLCENSPVAIALDEELIGLQDGDKERMIKNVQPKYIILKPSLLGGIEKCEDWIEIANKNKIKWWATSALESNIGLNAIAQWVYQKDTKMKQGLGTGKLFSNNILSPYIIEKGCLKYSTENKWDLKIFDQQKRLFLK